MQLFKNYLQTITRNRNSKDIVYNYLQYRKEQKLIRIFLKLIDVLLISNDFYDLKKKKKIII